MMKYNGRKMKMTITAACTVGMIGLSGVGTASASHVHSMETGNGSCVLLAQNGGEKEVTLPHAEGAENRRHPLHVNVHLGEPGEHIDIGVFGNPLTDPCFESGSYLND
jgi:hypothetical protein